MGSPSGGRRARELDDEADAAAVGQPDGYARRRVSGRAGDMMIVAVALIILAAIVAMGAFSLLAAQRIDNESRTRWSELVVESFQRRAVSLQRDLASFAHWDESVLRTAYYLDLDWVHKNFGRWLHDTQHHDRSYILLESGVAYASIDGVLTTVQGAPFDGMVIMPLVRGVRDAYATQAADVAAAVDDRGAPRDVAPVFRAGYFRVEGRPALVGAISITPDYGRVISPKHAPPIAVTVLFIDEGFLRDLVSELHIVDPVIAENAPPDERQSIVVPFHDPQTKTAWLSWKPENPGSTLLQALLPALLGTAVLLLCAAAVILWYARRATQDLAESEALAMRLAHVDPLCGIPNRTALMRDLGERLAHLRGRMRLAVFFLDLDGFKDVNDTLGHHIGDMLLAEIGHRLKLLPITGALASRFGGDEFVIVVPLEDETDDIDALGSLVLESVRRPALVAGHTLVVNGTIGATIGPDHSAEANELIRLADIAVYRAKAESRGSMRLFEPKMERDVIRRREIEIELQRAIAKGELTVYYQPQFTTDGEAVVGFEALVRWIHPVKGMISPGEFIPIAEQTGLITELDMLVLRKACQDARGWRNTKLAVNLSPVDFRMRDLAVSVERILKETGFPAERLEIEITENLLFDNQPEAFAQLSALRNLGARIALDDFGSGYSSLGYIRRFRVDTIKIDRSFTQNIAQTDDAAAIIDCVVRLARALAITVTAEGVETREQLRYLQSVGCHNVQGFLLAGPMPVSNIAQYVQRAVPLSEVTPQRQRLDS